MELREHEKSYRLNLSNGISLEVLRRGKAYGGIGQVKLGRRKLRSAELPVMPFIQTPDGYRVAELRIQDVDGDARSVTFGLHPYVVRDGRMEWVCCDGQDRWNVGPWERDPVRDRGGRLEVTVRPVEREIGGLRFVGFSYAYKFRSRKYRVYRIHDRATWELGGRASGNSVWMRGPFNEPQQTFKSKADAFTTSWCHSARTPVQLQQFLPLFTVLQGFTFQSDRQSVLVTAFEEPFHCRTLLHKGPGENYLIHWHQLCGDLKGFLDFPALQVLCAQSPADDDIARANQYCAVRDELRREYAARWHLALEPAPVSGRLVSHGAVTAEAMQRGIDELAHAGCARVYAPGLLHALAPDRTGARGSRVQARGEQQVSRLVRHAHRRGMEVAVPLSDACAGWLVRRTVSERSGGPPVGTDVPAGDELVTCALRQRDMQRLLLDHMRRVRGALGLDAVFAESMVCEIGEQFDWRSDDRPPRKRASGASRRGQAVPGPDEDHGQISSLQAAQVGLLSALQAMGYKCPLSGIAGLGGAGAFPAARFVYGREHLFRDCVLDLPEQAMGPGTDRVVQAYFRACANRVSYALVYDANQSPAGRLAGWWRAELAAINTAYQAVAEHMERCVLLPAGRGVLWSGADADLRVLWCYKSFKWAAGEEAEAFDVVASRCVDVEGGVFTPEPLSVYLVQNADDP